MSLPKLFSQCRSPSSLNKNRANKINNDDFIKVND